MSSNINIQFCTRQVTLVNVWSLIKLFEINIPEQQWDSNSFFVFWLLKHFCEKKN